MARQNIEKSREALLAEIEMLRGRITALERNEVERERLIDELDTFAHMVAHDLKNPLGLILGYASILDEVVNERFLDDDDLSQIVPPIVKTANRMGRIIDSLLMLASVRKLDDVYMEQLEMGSIVQEAQHRVQHLLQTYQGEIVIPDCWPIARGYAPWVEEVWANYLSNALKYGGRPPLVEVGGEVEGSMVRFWVRDNGPGLSPEEQARLFTPFTRLAQARVEGHGLGLSIVRRVVEKLRGEAGVESQPGQGSTFYFTLPAQ